MMILEGTLSSHCQQEQKMNDTIHFINSEGLLFSEKVNASISHELNNILATISETSGLLNDLTGMARQGQGLKLSQLERCNDSIAQEAQRGFSVVRQMNRFAHSVASPIKEIDIVEVVKLTINLYGFLKNSGNIQIRETDKDMTPVLTSPFLLQNLIYRLLTYIFEYTDQNGDTHIDVRSKDKDCVHVIFSSPSRQIWETFPTPKVQQTAQILGVKFKIKNSFSMLDLQVPYVSKNIVALAKELQICECPL